MEVASVAKSTTSGSSAGDTLVTDRRFELLLGGQEVDQGLQALELIPDLSVEHCRSRWLSRIGGLAALTVLIGDEGELLHPAYVTVLESRLGGRVPRVNQERGILNVSYLAVLGDLDERADATEFAFGIAGSLNLPDLSVLLIDTSAH